MGFPKLGDDSIIKGMARLMEQVKVGQLEINALKLSFYPYQMLGILF